MLTSQRSFGQLVEWPPLSQQGKFPLRSVNIKKQTAQNVHTLSIYLIFAALLFCVDIRETCTSHRNWDCSLRFLARRASRFISWDGFLEIMSTAVGAVAAGVAFRPGFRGLETSGSPQPSAGHIIGRYAARRCGRSTRQRRFSRLVWMCSAAVSFEVGPVGHRFAAQMWNSFPWKLGSVHRLILNPLAHILTNFSDQSTSISGNCKHLLRYTRTRKWRIPCEEALRHGAGFNRIGIRGKCNGEIRQMQRFARGVCLYRSRL